VNARLCNNAETSLPWKLLRTCLESCASIVQAAVCRPPRYWPDELRRPPKHPRLQAAVCRPPRYWPDELRRPPKHPRRCSAAAEQCPLKSRQKIHVSSRLGRRRSVAQASFNHPRWCRPHSVCPRSHLQLGCGGHSQRISISAIFPREFLIESLLDSGVTTKETLLSFDTLPNDTKRALDLPSPTG